MNVFRLHGQRGTKQPNIASIIIKSTRAQKKTPTKELEKEETKNCRKKNKGCVWNCVIYIRMRIYIQGVEFGIFNLV